MSSYYTILDLEAVCSSKGLRPLKNVLNTETKPTTELDMMNCLYENVKVKIDHLSDENSLPDLY